MSCDALRRAGRAGGVDQRERRRRARPRASAASTSKSAAAPPRRRRATACPRAPRRRRTITCSSAGQLLARLQHAGRSACSTIDDARAGVADHVGDLLGRVGRGRSRTASRRASPPRGRRGGTRGGWRASARPCRRGRRRGRRRPRGERVDALAQLAPRSSETASSSVRTATRSGCAAAVRRSASASVGGVDGARRRAPCCVPSASSLMTARRSAHVEAPARQPADVVERPITNSMITSTKPTTPARSMTANGIGRPRTFSASAQKMWPPSSGRNGNRLMIAERERDQREDARAPARCSNPNDWRVTS